MDPQAERLAHHIVDGISAAAILGTLFGYLPGIAAMAGIIWYGIQIYESKTVQKALRRRRLRARRHRLERAPKIIMVQQCPTQPQSD